MKLAIKKILPKNWKYIEDGNKAIIYYKNFKQKQPNPIKLNKNIVISEDLGVLLGFWAGDGIKRSFGLVNGNIQVLGKTFSILKETLGINVKELNLRIRVPLNFKNKEKLIKEEAKKFFKGIEDIKTQAYLKKRNYPSYIIYQNKIVFIKFFRSLYNYLSDKIPKHHMFWDGYLKGIIAAEGHMGLRKKYNTLSKIHIAQIDKKIRKNITQSLKIRGVKFNKNKKYIMITGKRNFKIILKRKLYNLHPEKSKQFILGYENIKQNQYYPNEVKRLILNEFKVPRRVSVVAKKLNRCRQTIREHILLKENSFYDQALIKKCGQQRGARGPFYGDLWTLTKKGLNLLEEK